MFYEEAENIYDDLNFLKQALINVGRSGSTNEIMTRNEIKFWSCFFKEESKKLGYRVPELFKYNKTSGELFKYLQQQGSSYAERDEYIATIFNPILEFYEGDDYFGDVVSSVNLKEKMISDNGSYALVYKFKDPITECHLAYKSLRKNVSEKEIARFNHEYEIMSKLNSNNIVKVFKRTEDGYIMELCDYTLDKYFELNNSTLTRDVRRRMLTQLFRVLDYLHYNKILHRDLSYRNVLVIDCDDCPIIKISDFGLVKTLESKLTSQGTEIKGSLADPWLHVNGFEHYHIKNEIYSLGFIVNKIITGKDKIKPNEIKNVVYKEFMLKFIDPSLEKRFSTVIEAARECFQDYNNYFDMP